MNTVKLFGHELRAIFTNAAVVLTVFVGIVFYSFLYPLPYAQQIPRNLPLVVANLDNSELSRSFERMVDATPQLKIVKRTGSIKEAEAYYLKKRLAGILVIPENFYKDILLGKRPTLSYSGDASYFLVYGTVFQGLGRAGNTLSARLKLKKMMLTGKPKSQAKEEITPVILNVRPVFNSTGAYLNYVLPAVLVLILHHTLIIGTGIITGSQKAQDNKNGYWKQASAFQILMVRTILFSLIYLVLSCYYFGFTLSFNEVPRLAAIADLFMIWLPLVIAASSIGIILGRVLPRPELVTIVVVLPSLPLFFASGFIWPVEALPRWLTILVQWVPAVPGINGFLKLNQLGTGLHDVLDIVVHLWCLALLFGFGALIFLQEK